MSISTSTIAPEFFVSAEKIGAYTFKNPVSGETLDIVSSQFWAGNKKVDPCQICTQNSAAMVYKVQLEWGDTKRYETISAVCHKCLKTIKSCCNKLF